METCCTLTDYSYKSVNAMFLFCQSFLVIGVIALEIVSASDASELHRGFSPRSNAKSSSNSKVFFGSDAKRNKYPFAAYMRLNETAFWCSASLINSQWGLTAAHCTGRVKELVLGDYTRSYTNPQHEGSEQVIPIEQEFNHPDYKLSTIEHDIALLKLAYPANLSSDAVAAISPLKSKKYMEQMLDNKKSCRVLGWGYIPSLQTGYGFDFPSRLQEIRMEFVNATDYLGADVYSRPGMMPVKAVYEKTDKCKKGGPCYGDSGAPLVCKRKGKWIQTGVHSFSYTIDGCIRGTKGMANVQQHFSWIESIIEQ